MAAADHVLSKGRLSTEAFHRLVREGSLREGSSAFLWDGEIFEPLPKNRPHINVEGDLRDLLAGPFPRDAWTIDVDSPLHLRDGFDPQPDLMVLRGPRSEYRVRAPSPADVALLVEVSSTTYADDSGAYLREYARAAVSTYWIVNLEARRVEVHCDPDAIRGLYRDRRVFGPGDAVPLPMGLADLLAVDDIFRNL